MLNVTITYTIGPCHHHSTFTNSPWQVLECDGQLAFTGATRLLKEFVDPTMLGAAPGQHAPTFKWEQKDLVYVCEANFTKARVLSLLQDAVNTHMAHAKVQILEQ